MNSCDKHITAVVDYSCPKDQIKFNVTSDFQEENVSFKMNREICKIDGLMFTA